MSSLLVVAIAAVAIGLTIRSARRGIGDRQTLEAHHRALDTLAEMSAHRASPPPARAPASPRPAHAAARGRKRPPARPPAGPTPVSRGPVGPPSGPAGAVGPAAPLGWARPVAPAETPSGGYAAEAPLAPPMPTAALVAQSLATSGAMRSRPPQHRRRAVPPAFVGAVGAVVVGALGLAVGLALVVGGHHDKSGVNKPATAAARAPQAPPTTSAAPVVLAAGDNQEARFQVNRTGTRIDLVATGACWIQIRTGNATGAVLFTGVLHPGDRRPVPVGQPVWVRIGNPPGMSVQVNGTLLPYSAPISSQPFNLVFQPST